MTIELLTSAGFVMTAGLTYLVGLKVLRVQRDPVRKRLAAVPAQGRISGHRAAEHPLVGSLAGQLPVLWFDNEELSRDLRRAGYYRPAARRRFLALRNGLVILVAIATAALVVLIGPERQGFVVRILAVGLLAAGLCWGTPRVVVSIQARRRVERIRRALPNALDMISMCLTGGLTVQQVLAHIRRQLRLAHPDLATELSIVEQQAEMSSLEKAFEWFAERIDAPETRSLADLIAQNQRLGTDVAGSVREYADNMRLKRRQAADERFSKAQVKLLFPMVLCLVPAAILFLWGPAALRLWEFYQGFDGASPLNL